VENVTVYCRSGSLTSSPNRSRDGDVFESSYVEYLRSARVSVQNCINACQAWSAPYDGEYPTIESFSSEQPDFLTSDGNVVSGGRQDKICLQDELNVGDVESRMKTAVAELGNTALSLSSANSLASSATADDGVTQMRGIPSPSLFVIKQLMLESVSDNGEASLAAVSSNSRQDASQPVVPSEHLSTGSAPDDLESFIRQLSHVSCKSDADDTAVDILTEFDEVISEFSASSSEDPDSQKTLTPEDHVATVFSEDSQLQTENEVPAGQNPESPVDTTENVQSSDDIVSVETKEGKMPDSAADGDRDDENNALHSRTCPFSGLLYCRYEPPYLPTVGMCAFVASGFFLFFRLLASET